jgi:crotonobetainyl-CoA:carnitine CoA-transferase CaiB-like acyl-CoA transferase
MRSANADEPEEPVPPLLVVDLSKGRAGALCAKLFGMGGANVIKLRDEEFPGFEGTTGVGHESLLHEYVNSYKVGAVVEPDRNEPAALITGAVAVADVVVTSMEGGLSHLGIGEEEVRRMNPSVIHASISPFGTTGPYATWKSSSLLDWAASGYLFITGDPDREPLAGPEGICEAVCAYTAAMAIEAALAARRNTGRGCYIDASVMEAMVSSHQSTFSRYAAGVVMGRSGNEVTTCYPLGVKRCRDGHILISVVTDQDFDRLAIAMGLPHLVADPRFSDGISRYQHRDTIDAVLDPWLRSMDGDDIAGLLQAAGVVAAKVVTTLDLLSDPQLESRHFFDGGADDDGGVRLRMPGNPVRSARRPPCAFRRAPQGRGHTDGVQELMRRGGQLAGLNRPTPQSAPGQPFGPEGRPLTVLDATIWWAGPLATRLLADLGARVIRIERPAGRDDTYHDSGQYVTHKLHRGKLSLAVDSRTAEGRAIVHQLARSADVFIENFRPGVMAKLGLDFATLSALNPKIVYVSLSGFGSDGPRAAWGSHGTLIEAASSIESRTGYVGDEPMKLGHPLPDGVGGTAGAFAALRGLRTLSETGEGSYFDISQLETYCAAGGEAVLATSLDGVPAPALGNASPLVAPQNVYPCRGEDEWVAISISDDDEWSSLQAILTAAVLSTEDRDLLADPALCSVAGRMDRQVALDAAIANWARTQAKKPLAAMLQAAGIRAFPVMTSSDLVSDPQVAARHVLVDVPFGSSVAQLPGAPVRTSDSLFVAGPDAPRLGQHTRQILMSDLQFDELQIDELVRRGVVATDATDATDLS